MFPVVGDMISDMTSQNNKNGSCGKEKEVGRVGRA